jgi:hypothetical protein
MEVLAKQPRKLKVLLVDSPTMVVGTAWQKIIGSSVEIKPLSGRVPDKGRMGKPWGL